LESRPEPEYVPSEENKQKKGRTNSKKKGKQKGLWKTNIKKEERAVRVEKE